MSLMHLRPSRTTPLVVLDDVTGDCYLIGDSMPENSMEFYGHLMAWMDQHLPGMTSPVRWHFRMHYFNTSSTKGLYQMLARIKAEIANGKQHEIIWDVENSDEFMREAGENFIELLDLELVFREITDEAGRAETEKLYVDMINRAA
jgi:hypothetical protein